MSRIYTTVQGDMWDSIAYSQLGSTTHTDSLIAANPAYRNIYSFPAGIQLILPDLDDVRQPSDNLPPWKEALG